MHQEVAEYGGLKAPLSSMPSSTLYRPSDRPGSAGASADLQGVQVQTVLLEPKDFSRCPSMY